MSEKFVIAVSGTPGTGKSTFSRHLADDLNCRLLDLNKAIDDEDIYEMGVDGVKLVDPGDLQRSFDKKVGEGEDVVIDGLLSHLLSPEQVTHVIVLRTHPDILEDRLSRRNYSDEKIMENVEAEALGVILSEAVEIHGIEKVFEIDTSGLDPEESLKYFKNDLKGENNLKPGSIDWLEDYFEKKVR